MTIGIVGCGLIGGSIGLACRGNGHTVLGFEPDIQSAKVAQDRGCVSSLGSLEEVAQSDLTFIAVPPHAVFETARAVLSAKPKHTTITDCTSVKGEIVRWLSETGETMFVPGHPMAGHEKSGPQYASAWMFRGAKWILTPTRKTYSGAIRTLEGVLKELGSTVVRVDAEQHDREVALLSHLPHALAAILVKLADGLNSTEASAGSWKDLTRVGGVDPTLWSQILMGNRVELIRVLTEFNGQLDELTQMLQAGDQERLLRYFQAAKEAKEKQK